MGWAVGSGWGGVQAVGGLDTLSSHPRATKILVPLQVSPCRRTSEHGSVEGKVERAWGFYFSFPLVCVRGLAWASAPGRGWGLGLELGGFLVRVERDGMQLEKLGWE